MADKDNSSKPTPVQEGYEHVKPPMPMKPTDRPFTGGYEPPPPPKPPPKKQGGDSGSGEKK